MDVATPHDTFTQALQRLKERDSESTIGLVDCEAEAMAAGKTLYYIRYMKQLRKKNGFLKFAKKINGKWWASPEEFAQWLYDNPIVLTH